MMDHTHSTFGRKGEVIAKYRISYYIMQVDNY